MRTCTADTGTCTRTRIHSLSPTHGHALRLPVCSSQCRSPSPSVDQSCCAIPGGSTLRYANRRSNGRGSNRRCGDGCSWTKSPLATCSVATRTQTTREQPRTKRTTHTHVISTDCWGSTIARPTTQTLGTMTQERSLHKKCSGKPGERRRNGVHRRVKLPH